ncbi:hypothetical protein ACFW3E_38380, partial [Streptomyces sp. NPDC058861]
MLYLLTDDYRRALVSLPVPDNDMVTVAVERADQPGLLLAALDLHADGTVNVGHWPTGEDWERVLTTRGKRDELHWMQHSSRRQHGRSCRSQACCRISGR